MGKIVDPAEVLLILGLSASATDEERALVGVAITHAEGAVKRYLRYDPAYGTRTEFYPRPNALYGYRQGVWEANASNAYLREQSTIQSTELQLSHVPVRSVTGLWIDYDGRAGTRSGSFAAETAQVEGEDFWPNFDGLDSNDNGICLDGLLRSQGLWPIEPGSVKVTYVSGYTDDELHGQDTIIDATAISDVIVYEAAKRVRKAFVWEKNAQAGFLPGPLSSESLGSYSWSADTATAGRIFGGLWELDGESIFKLQTFVHWGLNV